MPLMWINSAIMFLFVIFILINMYYYQCNCFSVYSDMKYMKFVKMMW